jgi:hypothetical protein
MELMKVDKGQFDSMLHKMALTPPAPTKTIKSEKQEATIISPLRPLVPNRDLRIA